MINVRNGANHSLVKKIHLKIVGKNSVDIFNRRIKVRVSQHVPYTDQGVHVPHLTNVYFVKIKFSNLFSILLEV